MSTGSVSIGCIGMEVFHIHTYFKIWVLGQTKTNRKGYWRFWVDEQPSCIQFHLVPHR